MNYILVKICLCILSFLLNLNKSNAVNANKIRFECYLFINQDMNILNLVISSLSKEEIRYFKILAQRMEGPADRKDLQLIDYIRKNGNDYNDDTIARKLYGKGNKDAYYRLKNRLLDSICDFLVFHHLWKSDSNELNRYLSLNDIFRRKSQFKVALFYLKKAEQKALSMENFELLDVIYGHFIALSGNTLDVNPEQYIVKQKENSVKLNLLRETDQALAALSYRLKVTQNVAAERTNALDILRKTIQEFTTDTALKKSKSFQTRVYRAVSQILLQQHNYQALEVFLKDTFKQFESNNWFDKENHESKLQMLTYLVNSLFRNEKYKESLEYADILRVEIKAYNQLFYDKYLFFYYNSLVINYSALDKKKALTILERFEQEIKNKKNSYYDQFLYFNKAMLLHQLGKPAEAVRNIVRLYVNDNYKKADESFKLKISVVELIMHFDAGDPDTYLRRSKSVIKEFKKLLTTGDFKREQDLTRIMNKMAINPGFKTDIKLRKMVDALIESDLKETAVDAEIIRYSQWLGHKWGIKFNQRNSI